MENSAETKISIGVCLSEFDRNIDFRFDCMENMKESFCMLRIGTIMCDNGTFYLDKCFKEYAKSCNELSIPWVGYVYLQNRTDNPQNKIFIPNYGLCDVFDEIPLSLPYIVAIFDFDIPNFTLDRLDDTVQLLGRAISHSADKPFTMCVGLTGKCEELANHSEFKYPLYVERLIKYNDTTINVSNNTILCWYYQSITEAIELGLDGIPSFFYTAETADDKIKINLRRVYLDTAIAIGELADAVQNYRGSV